MIERVLYNVMFEEGVRFVLKSNDEGAIALQYPGKPLWLYVNDHWGAENLQAFFNTCLQKIDGITGLVAPKWAAQICPWPTTFSWELTALFLPTRITHVPKGRLVFPDLGDLPMISEWIEDFYFDVLAKPFPEGDKTAEALILSNKLYILAAEGLGKVAMGMIIPIPNHGMSRINLIYTPHIYRGRGFGRDITAAISIKLQEMGQLPVLYVRTENVTAMQMYRSLGFAEAGQLVELRF